MKYKKKPQTEVNEINQVFNKSQNYFKKFKKRNDDIVVIVNCKRIFLPNQIKVYVVHKKCVPV